jgi:hypothetical protein
MRLFDPHLPIPPQDVYQVSLNRALGRVLREFARDHDALSYGYLQGVAGKATAAPTTGTWALGDYIRNSNPSELGVALSKYWIRGWWCSVAGTPGTWLEDRGLTGN